MTSHRRMQCSAVSVPAGPLGLLSLAMHAWDQPAEALLELGTKVGTHLVMPQLGEPVEPAYVGGVEPWWRGVDATARASEPQVSATTSLPKAMSWPMH